MAKGYHVRNCHNFVSSTKSLEEGLALSKKVCRKVGLMDPEYSLVKEDFVADDLTVAASGLDVDSTDSQ